MAANTPVTRRTFGTFILSYRRAVGAVLLAVTILMAVWAVRVPIATRFEDLFPSSHPNTVLYRKHRVEYGRALTLALLLRVDRGDIFNLKTLQTIQDINHEVDILPGVNHNELFSIASYRVFYATATPGTLTISPYMYPRIPRDQKELTALEDTIREHQRQLTGLVTEDLKGALITASFNEGDLDYKAVFDGVQAIIARHQDGNTHIYASGPVMFYGWGYHYLPLLEKIFAASVGLSVLLTFLLLRGRAGWWAPIVTGLCSAVWGLGFMSIRRYNFDPTMLVIPVILTARAIAHGIQWQGRFYTELARSDDRLLACVATADGMLKTGFVAVLANVAGIVFIGLSDIPALQQLGVSGAVWMLASLVLVFVGQPILMSYVVVPRAEALPAEGSTNGTALAGISLASPAVRGMLSGIGFAAIVIGLLSSRHLRVGFQTTGTPLYRTDAQVNRDTAEISRYVPINTAWVVLQTPEYPSPQSGYGTKTLRMVDDMSAYLLRRGDVAAVIDLDGLVEKPMNQLFHNDFVKYFAMPDTEQLSVSLFFFFVQSATPDEVTAYFENLMSARNSCIRLLLPDHTSARLARLREDLDYFVRNRVETDPTLKDVKVAYLGGDAGLYQASDDVMAGINARNLILVLGVIFLICILAFRSLMAGVLLLITALAANLIAYTYMNYEALGLTVDTVSVVSLGLGIGISYAIYALAAIRNSAGRGLPLMQAIRVALEQSGATVFITYLVMIAALIPWVFSPVLFQNDMSTLLIILMTTNLVAGLLILPALLMIVRPRFLVRHEAVDSKRTAAA
jgi:predicted RND superfamily exporter protein